MGYLLEGGSSWSGHERNRCFLNTRDGRFADVSGVFGFDLDADSRAIASVDWDRDGDLDLWVSNRTGPRVHFLRNDTAHDSHALIVRLRGTRCNRDAIGARLELETQPDERGRRVRTVRAGDGYLSQSSRWHHFAVSSPTASRTVKVRWPDGSEQSFVRLLPSQRYTLVQDGAAIPHQSRRDNVQLKRGKSVPPTVSSNMRIVPHRRLPFPALKFDAIAGGSAAITEDHQFTLLTVWATWCQPCLAELAGFSREKSALLREGVRWVPVNVDDYQQGKDARQRKLTEFFRKAKLTPLGVIANEQQVVVLDVVQRIPLANRDQLPVPCSFLLDDQRRLMAIYKGRVTPEQVLDDVTILSRSTPDPRDVAIPFPGRWATNAFPPDLLAIPRQLVQRSLALPALEYLAKHVPTAEVSAVITREELGSVYAECADQLAGQKKWDQAIEAYEHALRSDPELWSAHLALANVYQANGKLANTVQQYKLVLTKQAGQPMALNNLAWILSTTADTEVRDPKAAFKFAEQLCRQTGYRQPVALGTLAATYAANDDFDKAKATVDKAIELAEAAGQTDLAKRMRTRLERYAAGQAIFE